LKRFKIALPSTSEQASLVDHIRAETDTLQKAIRGAEHEITLLIEYRTRLIADVVTGQLDIRAAVSQLPLDDIDPDAAADIDDDEDTLTDDEDELAEAAA